MKINEIINPNIPTGHYEWLPSDEETNVLKFITTHCSDILKFYKNTGSYLYRGIKGGNNSVFIGSPRIDRIPLDTPITTQTAIDNKLKEAGFTALRSNSIFCSSDIMEAYDYGEAYIVFPCNGFTYTWAEYTRDLTKKYTLKSETSSTMLYDLHNNITSEKFVEKYKFKNNVGLTTAMRQHAEIYIHGKYIALLSYSDIREDVTHELGLFAPTKAEWEL